MFVVKDILLMLTMKEMFSDLRIDVIQNILIANDLDFERSFDQLLDISLSEIPRPPKIRRKEA